MTKQDILEYFNDINNAYNNPNKHDDLSKMLDMLAQEPKTGHWIEDTNGTYTDNHDTWECSECGHAQILLEGTPKDNDYNYCPSCGAKMIEPQESEGGK